MYPFLVCIFSSNTTHASGVEIIVVRQGLFFFKFSTSPLSLLDSYSNYVGSTSLETASPRSHFLMFMLPLFAFLRWIEKPTPFFPSFFSPEISSFWGTSPAINYFFFGTKKFFRNLALITYQFCRPSFSGLLPLPLIFRQFVGMTLVFTSILTVLLKRNTPLYLFHCCCYLYFSGTEYGQIFHLFRPHQTPF